MDATGSGIWEPPEAGTRVFRRRSLAGRVLGVGGWEPRLNEDGGEGAAAPWREPVESPDELVNSDPNVAMGRWCLQGDWTPCREQIRFGFSSCGLKLRQVVFSFCLWGFGSSALTHWQPLSSWMGVVW